MNILLLIDNLNSGGSQRQIVNLAKGLKDNGHHVIILTYTEGSHFEPFVLENEIRHVHISKEGIFNFFSFIAKIHKLVKETKIEVICAYLFSPSIIAFLIKFLSKNIKVVTSERSHQDYDLGYSPIVARKMYRFADAIVANSFHKTEYLKQHYPKYAHKIVTIFNGLDLSLHNRRKRHGKLQLIGIGSITTIKNTKLLIEAAKCLMEKHKLPFDVKWLGRDYDVIGVQNQYAKECKKMVEHYDMQNVWHWEGKQYDVNKYLSHADILIHTSHLEGFPNVIAESLAMGCPVITSDMLDNPIIIRNGYNGFLFKPNDLASLVEKILKYTQLTHQEIEVLSSNARTTAEEKFSIENLTHNYEQLFERLLSK